MREHPSVRFRPALEPVEARRLLSVAAAHPAGRGRVAQEQATVAAAAVDRKPTTGFLVYRITNPNRYNNHLTPPFGHVLVQSSRPVPGQVYNILQIAVRNGTAQTFDANSNFFVRFPGQKQTFPILTGDQTWVPGQDYIFYVLSKQYYPLPSQVHSGFDFSLAGARSVGIPGPSGIFLRVKYNPATIDSTLDKIVTTGPGSQGGKGIRFGLPDTAIYEFVSSKTDRIDFSGYF